MKSDTKIIGAVIGMGMLLVSVMVFQSASTNARIDGMQSDVNARFERLDTRIDDLRSDMREDHAVIHMRLDGVHMRLDGLQEGLSEVAQRLSHVEGRLSMPRGSDGQATP